MNSTGLFTIHQYTIRFEKYGEPIYIIPFGDIHRSSTVCAVEHWQEFCEWARTKKHAFFLGMGDYDDLMSSSERAAFAAANIHDQTKHTIEDVFRDNTKLLAKELSFMRGRLIGLLSGNHFGQFPDGTTTDQMLCRLLANNGETPKHLGVCSLIRLTFICTHRQRTSLCLDIFAHHGLGAARLIGGSLNRVQQMAEMVEADIHLMGHDHKRSVAMMDRLCLTQGGKLCLKNKKLVFARTGSFLKGYEPGEKSYVADALMSPTNLGVVKIEITPRRERHETDGVEHISHGYLSIHAGI